MVVYVHIQKYTADVVMMSEILVKVDQRAAETELQCFVHHIGRKKVFTLADFPPVGQSHRVFGKI